MEFLPGWQRWCGSTPRLRSDPSVEASPAGVQHHCDSSYTQGQAQPFSALGRSLPFHIVRPSPCAPSPMNMNSICSYGRRWMEFRLWKKARPNLSAFAYLRQKTHLWWRSLMTASPSGLGWNTLFKLLLRRPLEMEMR